MQNRVEQQTKNDDEEPQHTKAGAEMESVKEEYSQAEAPIAGEMGTQGTAFRPPTRVERRSLWFKEYGEQDFALQMWVRLVEQQDLDVEMMFQIQGLLVFGVVVSTARYAQFYIDLNEELHRERDPEVADALRVTILHSYPRLTNQKSALRVYRSSIATFICAMSRS